jgi:hypothetical protein
MRILPATSTEHRASDEAATGDVAAASSDRRDDDAI